MSSKKEKKDQLHSNSKLNKHAYNPWCNLSAKNDNILS